MECICCGSAGVTERPERTPFAGFPAAHAAGTFASFARGYRRFRCRECGKQYNERSGGLLNRAHYPSDVIALVLAGELRRRRNGKGGANRRRWPVDETYLKVRGRWCYLYRAIDRNGDLVDTMLSEHRDMAAAQAFFRSAKSVTGQVPERVTTDGHGSHPRAIRSTLGRHVVHRTSAYKNNRLEQDHRGVKGRTRCMRGFKSFASAERFCRGYDELRNLLRPRTRHNQHIPANRRRLLHLRRASSALAMLEAA